MKNVEIYLGIVCTIFVLLLTQVVFASWDIDVVDKTLATVNNGSEFDEKGMSYRSFAIGDDGKIHIAYVKDMKKLFHAYYNKENWHIEMVDTTSTQVMYPSITVDSNNSPHIIYTEGYYSLYPYNLNYLYKDGSGWHTEILCNSSYSFASPIALDTSCHPHTIFNTDDGLVYAYRDSSGWNTEILDVDAIGDSMALDESDKPHIIFTKDDSLVYAYKGSSGWQMTTVDSDLEGIRFFKIALDINNNPHVIFTKYDYTTNDGSLMYAYRDSSGWNTEIVDDISVDVSEEFSMALDKSGKPHVIVFTQEGYTKNDSSLVYTYRDSSGWQIETVDSYSTEEKYTTYVAYDYCSMALDSNDNPHITYLFIHDFDFLGYDALKYAYKVDSKWHKKTIDRACRIWFFHYLFGFATGGGIYSPSRIAIDSGDRPHISYFSSSGYACYLFFGMIGWGGNKYELKHAYRY